MEVSERDDYILSETLPSKSKTDYQREWDLFRKFIDHSDKPSEEEYIQYFDFLRNVKKYVTSTTWKVYSMLNHMHQHNYDEKLQALSPKLTLSLKSYNENYERKVASGFSKDNIEEFLENKELDLEPFWTVRKAMAVIAISGGLRCAEITDLNFNDMEDRGDTFMFSLQRRKQVGEQVSPIFVIPNCQYIYIINYLVALRFNLGDEAMIGRLFKGTPYNSSSKISKFVNQPMGKNTISHIGQDIATILNLKEPHTYTGHCFRRTAAKLAAEGGATRTAIKRHLGWKNESTAMKYIDKLWVKQQPLKTESKNVGRDWFSAFVKRNQWDATDLVDDSLSNASNEPLDDNSQSFPIKIEPTDFQEDSSFRSNESPLSIPISPCVSDNVLKEDEELDFSTSVIQSQEELKNTSIHSQIVVPVQLIHNSNNQTNHSLSNSSLIASEEETPQNTDEELLIRKNILKMQEEEALTNNKISKLKLKFYENKIRHYENKTKHELEQHEAIMEYWSVNNIKKSHVM